MLKIHRNFVLLAAFSASFLFVEQASSARQITLTGMDLSDQKTYLLKTTDGKRLAGRVDDHDATGVLMTRRNGRIEVLKPDEIKSIKKVGETFYPKSFQQMRVKLQKEFGSKYTVSVTRHFLVVHPKGDYEKWAMPFERLYVRFQAYFKTRGLVIDEPEFPMVAVVLRTRNEFNQMAKAHGMPANVIGYYSFHSNRLIAYQQQHKFRSPAQNLADTMDTMVHEATHQAAANTGIHSRLGRNPRWLTEGLATMFEAKGINNYFEYPEFKTRINWERLNSLRRLYENKEVQGTVKQLVVSDALFKHEPERAYAVAWALSLYLAERNPHRYVQYIETLQKNELTSSLSASRRMKYFFKAFGDPEGIEADMRRFIDRMPAKP